MMDTSVPEWDVVVVGGGVAGLVAATRAAELGKQVMLAEAGSDIKYPANSRYAGGVFHVAFQNANSGPQALEEAMEAETGGFADQALLKALASDAGRCIAWLAEHGAEFGQGGEAPWMAHMLVPFSLRETGFQNHWRDKGADRFLARLKQRFTAAGGLFRRGTRGSSLVMAEGRCVGLVLKDGGGQEKTVRCTAVVLADGGFQGNADLVRKYISPRPESLLTRGAGTGVGAGLQMAASIGAKLVHMDKFYGHVQCSEALHDESLWPYPILDIVASSAIVVNGEGMRFTDEGLGGVALANAIAKLQDPLSSFVIMDDIIWTGPGRAFLLPPNPAMIELGVKIYSAPSIAELALQLGMAAPTLERTVELHNAALASGSGAQLAPPRTKKSSTLASVPYPLGVGPYHAIRLCAGITYTMGGIAIDANGQVLNQSDELIPGLYACGSTTGGIEGGPETGYVGGLMRAAVFGLRAGEAVAGDAVQ
jgi:fumarate reductase flavoprotein subunit